MRVQRIGRTAPLSRLQLRLCRVIPGEAVLLVGLEGILGWAHLPSRPSVTGCAPQAARSQIGYLRRHAVYCGSAWSEDDAGDGVAGEY